MTFTYTFSYFLVTVVCSLIAVNVILQISINLGSEQEVRFFKNYVSWYIVFDLSNMIWVWINYGYLKIPGTPFSMINLIAICMASFYWFKYVEAFLSTDFVKQKLFRYISMVPLIIALAFILSTPMTKLVFYYNDNNEYIHGPLYATMFILAVSYLLFASVHIIIQNRHATLRSEKRNYMILAAFLIFPVMAGLLDIVAENLPVMELSLLFGTVLVHTNMLQSQVFYDRLTQLNNRSAADNYMQEHLPTTDEKEPLMFFIADADDFKSINDTYGHIEGDRALKVIGRAFKKYGDDHKCFMARWGGDEFCIIFIGQAMPEPETVINDIQSIIDDEANKAGLNYKLTLSMGYSRCASSLASTENIIDAADAMLYENKAKKKQIDLKLNVS